jgi:hypothetical protein
MRPPEPIVDRIVCCLAAIAAGRYDVTIEVAGRGTACTACGKTICGAAAAETIRIPGLVGLTVVVIVVGYSDSKWGFK